MTASLAERRAADQQHNRHVIRKLIFFSVLMLSLPVATFYYLHNYVFQASDNRTMWSGFGAIGVVNLVILVYIIEAFREDAQNATPTVPVVGKFKQQ
ncbi:hypothetical protein LEN26_000113 [Aphanomyces euteiches]|nr:hypothetical protein AeMF1_000016 [Aphanomyces euteiches]KAH9164308.1 hypothetical protein LEN26_000113 [Aphanomyces euteiches]KAH9194216.1 hypothetical protein AeNC1_003795 [Aphanomyces euteiches]